MAGGLAETGRWFLVTTAELVVLFLVLSVLVGLLQAWLPQEKVRSLFERRRPVTGYIVGAALGAVTPFCSYSTIPVLAGLLRSGAPFGPTIAFLFASPLLDPVVLGVLVFLIGVEGTFAYAVVTFAASVLIGALFARLGFEKDLKPLPRAAWSGEAASGCETACSAKGPAWRRAWADALRPCSPPTGRRWSPVSFARSVSDPFGEQVFLALTPGQGATAGVVPGRRLRGLAGGRRPGRRPAWFGAR